MTQPEQAEIVEHRYIADLTQRRIAALDVVVQEKQPEIVQHIEVAVPGGNTPLHIAVQHHQLEIVQFIMQHDPELLTWVNFAGQTALQLAQQTQEFSEQAKARQSEIVQYLLEQQQKFSDPAVLEQVIQNRLLDTVATGSSAVFLEEYLAKLDDLRPLLDIKNNQGQSLLHVAINYKNQEAIHLILEAIEAYGDKQALALTDAQGNSLLHYAVALQDVPLIAHLIVAGVDVTALF